MTRKFKDKALHPDQYYVNYNATNNESVDEEFEMLEDFESSIQPSQSQNLFPHEIHETDGTGFQFDSEMLRASIFTETQQPPRVNQRAEALDKELQKWFNTELKTYIQCKFFRQVIDMSFTFISSYERK